MNLDHCLRNCTWTRLWAIGHARGLPVPRQPTKAGLLDLVRADLLAGDLAAELRDLPLDAHLALHCLAAAGGRLPASRFLRRFGELRSFKPWSRDAPPADAPWRAPATITELLWYRGLLYAEGRTRLDAGFRLPDEFLPLLPAAPAPAQPVPDPPHPPEPTRLLYNLALLLAHLRREAPRPRQARWLTPRQFRPLLDQLWPPGCPLLAADRQRHGEKSTHLLRALHFVAEAAGFLPAPPPPPPHFPTLRRPPDDVAISMAPVYPEDVYWESGLSHTADVRPDPQPSPPVLRPKPPDPEPVTLDRLLPTPLWDRWLARSPGWQMTELRSLLTGRAEGLAYLWDVYRLPACPTGQPLAALRRVVETLALCPAGGAWLSLETFLRSLPWRYLDVEPGQPAQPDDPHRQLLGGYLAWLGLVQLDRWQAPTAFRLTPLGAYAVGAAAAGVPGAAYPQAPAQPLRLLALDADRLDLAVDPDCAPGLLYHLAARPELAWSAPGRLRLTPAALAGASPQALAGLVHLLDAGLPQPLDAETLHALQQWAGPSAGGSTGLTTGLALRRVTLLETGDPDLLAHLAGQRGLRRHLRRAYGRRAVELDSNSLESLLRKLRRQGLVPDVQVALDPKERPAANSRWGAEDAGHLLLAAKLYNRLPGRASLGRTERLFRPTHYIPEQTLERLAAGLPPRILETIDQLVEDTLRRLNDAIDGWRSPPPATADRPTPAALAETLALLRRALAAGQPVEIEYYTAGRGDLTRRTVEPLRLEDRDGVAYLVAYCRLRRDQRTFRVDRIRAARKVRHSEERA
jgi:hypothetical protein